MNDREFSLGHATSSPAGAPGVLVCPPIRLAGTPETQPERPGAPSVPDVPKGVRHARNTPPRPALYCAGVTVHQAVHAPIRRGRRFGELTAIEIAGRSSKAMLWLCRCSCGSLCIVASCDLRNRRRRDCGRMEHLRWVAAGRPAVARRDVRELRGA